MPKLRHIAIAAEDPEKMADFYKKAFDFKEVGRPNGVLADGVFLSDGTLNMAILKFKTDQLGKGLDYRGIHHFGVLVEDVDEFSKKLESLGAEHYIDQRPGRAPGRLFREEILRARSASCSTSPSMAGPAPSRCRRDQRGADSPNATLPARSRNQAASEDRRTRSQMAKLRHIAIAAKDPDAMAEFYKKAFDFKEVRKSDGPLAYGYHLSDGTIDLAILRFKTDQIGKGLDYTGLHHFGILVDDVEKFCEEGRGARRQALHGPGRATASAGSRSSSTAPKACCSTSPSIPGPAPSRCPVEKVRKRRSS